LRTLILQHLACEQPGVFGDVLAERGADTVTLELDEGDPLPDWRSFDAILAMGGPMSVNDDAEHPWLTEEKRLIGEAVRAGRPYWGACLGVQLLAASLGARVYPGPEPEVGVMPVRLTDDALRDPVFAGLPRDLPALQWHGDTFDLPEGAVRLAGSDRYPNQAFRWGRFAYGVQFHVEVSMDMAESWAEVPEYEAALDRVRGPGALPGLLAEFEPEAERIRDHGRRMFERWVDSWVGAAIH
jgi:GMP synthase (glutamine-hydrolysing)